MSDPIDNEQLLLLFRRAAKQMGRGRHHPGAPATPRARHAHDRDGHGRGGRSGGDPSGHAQGHILSILDEQGDMNQRQLLERLRIRSASLSELLQKLEKNGLVLRQRDARDRRNYRLFLTESGRALLDEHRRRRKEAADILFSALDEAERASLAALLTRLVTLWGEEETGRDKGGRRQARSES
ncbi:MAG: MarR family transcriptional regulator [Zoogloeaceae bacterium]|nr:MarR family transcriptional regulator [Zoogloeaceae bacterium]